MDKLPGRQRLILPQDFINYVETRFLASLEPALQPFFPREQNREVYLIHKEEQHLLGIETSLRWNPHGQVLRHTGIAWGVTYPIEVDQRPGSNPTGYIHLRPLDPPHSHTIKIQTTNFQHPTVVSGEELAARYNLQDCWTIDAVIDRLVEYAHQEFKPGRKRS